MTVGYQSTIVGYWLATKLSQLRAPGRAARALSLALFQCSDIKDLWIDDVNQDPRSKKGKAMCPCYDPLSPARARSARESRKKKGGHIHGRTKRQG